MHNLNLSIFKYVLHLEKFIREEKHFKSNI